MMYQHTLEGEGTKVATWAVRVSPPWLYSSYSSWPNFRWHFLFLFKGWESWTDYDTDCNNCITDTEGICKNNQMGPLQKVHNWDFYCKVPFSRYHSLLYAMDSLSCFFWQFCLRFLPLFSSKICVPNEHVIFFQQSYFLNNSVPWLTTARMCALWHRGYCIGCILTVYAVAAVHFRGIQQIV